jgi:putative GTP pyrophosphokinase
MAKNPYSKTQIDRLGDRLKSGPHTESDLRLLDDYRRSFCEAYETVVLRIRQRGEFPTGRLAKSTLSIVEKLSRESIRLSQIQDIAGCRVVLVDILRQERFVAALKDDFPDAAVIDRRENPSHGYRAIHVITAISGKAVEIQVRSSLQHLWAEFSEKSSDVLDPAIKYGGGSESWRDFLTKCSEAVARIEELEKRISIVTASIEASAASLESLTNAVAELDKHNVPGHDLRGIRAELEGLASNRERREGNLQELRRELVRLRNVTADFLTSKISQLEKTKGQK